MLLVHPSDFIPKIRSILSTLLQAPSKSPIRFNLLPKAISFNTELLKSFDYNIFKLIDAYPNSELSYGSEFHPTKILKPLLHQQYNWDRMEDFLSNGFASQFHKIDNDQRKADNLRAIKKSSHKSALENIDILCDQVNSEIILDFQFPFNLASINLIKHSIVAPYGMAIQ